jgi:S1-C subfamily serine protease
MSFQKCAPTPGGKRGRSRALEGWRFEKLRRHLRRLGIVLLLAVSQTPAASAPASAQQRELPPSRGAAQYSFASIVKRTAPAVVNVYVRGQAQTFVSPFANDPFFRRFFGEPFGLPQERFQSSLGSGVIVSPDGVVVTNAHVLKVAGAAAEIRLVLADRREFNAKVLSQDEKADVAVLRIEGGAGRFPHLEFADSDAA